MPKCDLHTFWDSVRRGAFYFLLLTFYCFFLRTQISADAPIFTDSFSFLLSPFSFLLELPWDQLHAFSISAKKRLTFTDQPFKRSKRDLGYS